MRSPPLSDRILTTGGQACAWPRALPELSGARVCPVLHATRVLARGPNEHEGRAGRARGMFEMYGINELTPSLSRLDSSRERAQILNPFCQKGPNCIQWRLVCVVVVWPLSFGFGPD